RYVLVAEAYHATYYTHTYTTYVNGVNQTHYSRVFNGYKYTHAVVLGLDQFGKKLWDHCFEMDMEQQPFVVIKNVRGTISEKGIQLMYSDRANMHSLFIDRENRLIINDLGEYEVENVKA